MLKNYTVAAILVAAGRSSRMGFDKLFYQFDGKTVFEHSLAAFVGHPFVDEIVVVAGANLTQISPLIQNCAKPCTVVCGGATRAESVQNGLAATSAEYVAIHDAARPFVSEAVITAALTAALRTGAAAPAMPVKDTIKNAKCSLVVSTPAREQLFAVQTPQCFKSALYREALKTVKTDTVTDDCSVFELANMPVYLTEGAYENYKITTQDDLPKEKINMRIGHGYDVHQLVEGRKLILGGVEIPFEKGLLGHSDADVLTHAVMDALLGAAALGDIGNAFPDTNAAYKNANSLKLLERVREMLSQNGFAVGNIDATILCQRPKLAPFIGTMRAYIAEALHIKIDDVSIKATTEEGLGFTGTGEGIAAHCVCLLNR